MWQQVGTMPGRTADSVPAQCALADVIQEAPHLMTLLQHTSRKALSGCNKQLRAIVHIYVTAIIVHNQNDLAQIVKGSWPQLAAILLRKQDVWDLCWPHNGNVQLLATVQLGDDGRRCAALFVSTVKKQQQPHAGAAAFSLFLSSKWADACYCAIQNYSTVATLDLSLSHWRRMNVLILAQSQLSCVAIGRLLSGVSWRLRCLDLTENALRAAGIELLVAAHLPNLICLWLGKTELDAIALQHLMTGKWPELHSLYLDGNQLDDMAVECLHSGDWPKLSSLCLNNNTFGALGIHHLTCGRWPMLDYLALDYTAMVTVLASFSMRCDLVPPVGYHTFVVARQLLNHSPDQPLLWPKLQVVHCHHGMYDYVAQYPPFL